MKRLIAALALSVVLLPGPAAGQEDPPPGGTTTDWDSDTLVVTAATPGTLELTDTPGAPFSGPRIYCAWFGLRIDGSGVEAFRIVDPEVGTTYVFDCWYTDPWVDPYPGYPIAAVFDPTVDPPGPLITTPEAARFALDSIQFASPLVVTSPAGAHVVGVPSWFAVASELDYEPASAQAGPVWATVRPVFRDVTWDLGDGDRLVCTVDATTEWEPTGPDTQATACSHTYRTAGDTPAAVSATVHWTVWQQTDRTAGAWAVWGTVSLTTQVDVSVVDLQAAIN